MQTQGKDKYNIVFKIKHFVTFITIISFTSCNTHKTEVSTIVGKEISLDSTLKGNQEILDYVKPYGERIETILDSALAYAPKALTKSDGEYNTTAGNLMADVVLEMANPIFLARTGKNIDFVVLNHGGIRSALSKGKVSTRTAYEIMPFENAVNVVELKGETVHVLAQFLAANHRAHPISGIQIVINKDDTIKSVLIKGEPVNKDKSYFVATSSYLVTGGDNMTFFKDGLQTISLDYFIRNAMIDYFKKVDTVSAIVDDRFYKLK